MSKCSNLKRKKRQNKQKLRGKYLKLNLVNFTNLPGLRNLEVENNVLFKFVHTENSRLLFLLNIMYLFRKITTEHRPYTYELFLVLHHGWLFMRFKNIIFRIIFLL